MASSKISQIDLGKTLIIVNPVAQSGQAKKHGHYVFQKLKDDYRQDADLLLTQHKGHAFEIAKDAAKYDSVIVVGGDGVVHETASGLMNVEKDKRPALGVIPVGSGNDYARSLGISFKVDKAIKQLMSSKKVIVDVGLCNDQYFVETLSFGLDAGIAIDTMKAREKHHEKGFKLYFKCGVNRIKNHFYNYKFEAELDGERKITGESVILAIQIGRTYGGGFIITPKAKMDDGKFDICYSQNIKSRKKLLALFTRAAKGKHVGSKNVCFDRAKEISLKIDMDVPCQLDGEEYSGREFEITTIPSALSVYKYKI